MSGATTGLVLHPLVGGDVWESEDTSTLNGVDGRFLADVRQAPPLLAQIALKRAAEAAGGPVPAELLARAGQAFAEEELAGESPQEYCRKATLAAGIPHRVFVHALRYIRDGLTNAPAATAAELPLPLSSPDHEVRWTRRGRTLAVVAPSNHPEPHLAWARAVSLGYGVVVRPGGRDPFTPLRLAHALYAAGLPKGRISILPGSHETAEFLVKHADRALVYGGQDTMARWAGRESVAVRGPGRSKVLLCGAADETSLVHVAHTVAADGGTRCTNTSVVLTTEDVDEVAAALATALARLPLLPVLDSRAALPAFTADRALALAAEVDRLSRTGLRVHRTSEPGPDGTAELADGSRTVPAAVMSTRDPGHPELGTELPFPFVLVAPWTAELGTKPLRDSLVLTVLGSSPELLEKIVNDPTVRRVVDGPADPWVSSPGLPHDGSLTTFLLEPKAVVRTGANR